MSHKTLVKVAAVLGGLCWVCQAAINQYDAAGAVVNALYWGGGALILVGLVGLGAGLVSGAPWLRLVVGLCFPVLVFAVLSVLRAEASDNVVDAGFGLALALICAASLLGGTPTDEAPRRRGSHAK